MDSELNESKFDLILSNEFFWIKIKFAQVVNLLLIFVTVNLMMFDV
jgi:uncharacterized membrane protein